MVDAKFESRFRIAGLMKNGKLILADADGYSIQATIIHHDFGGKFAGTLGYSLTNDELFSQDWLPVAPRKANS